MSMRQRVGQQDIEQFLVQVGRTRQPGRLYLVGGAAMVHRGIRPGQTLDIDIHITVDPGNLTAQIGQMKHRLNMNIEFASPADYMPLPTDWEARSQFLKRYGQVDVFMAFPPNNGLMFSSALSKATPSARSHKTMASLMKPCAVL